MPLTKGGSLIEGVGGTLLAFPLTNCSFILAIESFIENKSTTLPM